MGGYLEGLRLIGLSDLLTGRNRLHLPRELCCVRNGCRVKTEEEEQITLMGNGVFQKLQEQKIKKCFVWEHFL